MKIKSFSTLVFGLIAMQVVIPNFDASEVTKSEAQQTIVEKSEKQQKEVTYAPVNPTPEQVAAAAPTDIVVFADAKLEAAVAKKLGVEVGSITVNDMLNLTSIVISGSGVSNLQGLEYATEIYLLETENGSITDLSPISNLTKLTTLRLSSNQISDITPIANLTKISELKLNSNQISDLTSITRFTSLYRLNIYSNQISDITPIANLTNISELDLTSNQISDITPIANLTRLKTLSLSLNQISDLTPISDLTTLNELSLGVNQIKDISPVSELVNLERLALHENEISDITPIANLTNLKTLYLRYNQISDITPITNLTSLNILDVSNIETSDITPITNLTNLNSLYSNNNEISDITPITNLTNLKTLELDNNEISDITPITNLTNLETLDLENNEVSDITPIANLVNIVRLRLDNNEIRDISALKDIVKTGSNKYYHVRNQSILLEDKIATSNEEIIFNLIGFEGENIPFVLGVPLDGVNDFSKKIILNSGTYADNLVYSATVNQKVTFTELLGENEASTNEEKELTDEELIALFNVTNSVNETISVDSSDVNYSIPGDYTIVFSIPSGTTLNATLTVADVLPTINVSKESIEIALGSEIQNLLEEFGVVATEINEGDLTTNIAVDTSAVDVNVAGTYNVNFTVTDEEGNPVTKTVSIEVVAPTLEGIVEASTNEEKELTDEELIALFEVTIKAKEAIIVDASAVDYSTPGEYPVVFSIASGAELTTTLTILDVKPTIEIANDSVSIEANSQKPNLIEAFGVIATEITEGDLTANITVDDSVVDYSKAGTYDVIFTVTDPEGNPVSKTASIEITAEEEVVIEEKESEVESEIRSEETVEVESETATQKESNEKSEANIAMTDDNKQGLASTGYRTTILIVALTAIAAILVTLKKISTSKN